MDIPSILSILREPTAPLLVSLLGLASSLGCTAIRSLDDLEPGNIVDDAPCQLDSDCAGKHCYEGRCLPCPEGMLPTTFISGETFCIDRAEVTQAQYAEFLREVIALNVPPPPDTCEAVYEPGVIDARCKNPDDPEQPCAPCTSYDPQNTPDLPVTCVDHCDAKEYCLSRGKRLCGDREGDHMAVTDLNGDKDEWFVACSGANLSQEFPYEGPFDPGRCNVNPSNGLAEPGQFADCRSPSGVLDLSGNVAEWGTCYSKAGCLLRGGSYLDSEASRVSCAAFDRVGGFQQRSYVGIRCCAD